MDYAPLGLFFTERFVPQGVTLRYLFLGFQPGERRKIVV
jgi:hypothetical protein